MKQKFHLNEVALLAIISVISLASFLAFHAVEAAAGPVYSINKDYNASQYIVREGSTTTVTNSTAHAKIGIGPNVIITSGSSQIIRKAVDFLSNSTSTPLLSATYSSSLDASTGAIVART